MRWQAFVRAWGGVYVLCRYDEHEPFEANVLRAVEAVDAAICEVRP